MTYLFVPQKYNYFCRYTRCEQFFIKEKVFSGRSQSELLFYRPARAFDNKVALTDDLVIVWATYVSAPPKANR